jgi:dethiobiotin synthetase
MNFLITGTNTGVGKTYFSTGLIRQARKQGLDWIGMKPVCTGDLDDVKALMAASESVEPEHLINPLWLHTPLAPYVAAMIENRVIDLGSIRNAYRQLAARHEKVLVEGAGGLLVPILAHYDFRDLAQELNLEVIIVAANQLGVINQVLLTVEALKHREIACRCIILNQPSSTIDLAQQTNRSILESLTQLPILEIGYQEEASENRRHGVNPNISHHLEEVLRVIQASRGRILTLDIENKINIGSNV